MTTTKKGSNATYQIHYTGGWQVLVAYGRIGKVYDSSGVERYCGTVDEARKFLTDRGCKAIW